MYHTLTLVNNQVVEEIPQKLSQGVESLLGHLQIVEALTIPTYHYFSEQLCDTLALLIYLHLNRG